MKVICAVLMKFVTVVKIFRNLAMEIRNAVETTDVLAENARIVEHLTILVVERINVAKVMCAVQMKSVTIVVISINLAVRRRINARKAMGVILMESATIVEDLICLVVNRKTLNVILVKI